MQQHNAMQPVLRRRWALIPALALASLALVACSSSKSSTPAANTAGQGGVTITVKTGPAGQYLADGAGKALYLFAPDTGGKSTCTGTCAAAWPPLTGTVTAGSGVTASMLSTFMRADGGAQAVYNGHPLYYYIGDRAAGDTNGQGLNVNGGLWWLLTPAGDAITGTGGASSAPSSSTSSAAASPSS